MREKQEVLQKLKLIEGEAQSLHEENDFLKNKIGEAQQYIFQLQNKLSELSQPSTTPVTVDNQSQPIVADNKSKELHLKIA